MEKIYYPGIVERGADGYYISFPDLPGCVSAGDDMQALAANAEAALKLPRFWCASQAARKARCARLPGMGNE